VFLVRREGKKGDSTNVISSLNPEGRKGKKKKRSHLSQWLTNMPKGGREGGRTRRCSYSSALSNLEKSEREGGVPEKVRCPFVGKGFAYKVKERGGNEKGRVIL